MATNQIPIWWSLNTFIEEEDWNDYNDDSSRGPYLKVIVEITRRGHDGYCSGIDESSEGKFVDCFSGEEVDIEEHTYRMVAALPLKAPNGDDWVFEDMIFDPEWMCPSGGSGVCGIPSSVRFISATQVN